MGADLPASATAEDRRIIRLNVPVDMSNPADVAFLRMYEGLPDGLQLCFCKLLLVQNVPSADDDFDMLVARAIRDLRSRPRRKPGRKPRVQGIPAVAAARVTEVRPTPVVAPVSAEPSGPADAPAAAGESTGVKGKDRFDGLLP